MSQDTFNKLVTVGLFLFFGTVYIISFITGKPVDWQTLLAFIVPTMNHIVHLLTQTSVTNQTIKSDTAKAVADGVAPINGKSVV